ncbi:glycosyltransferase family 4 protein [Candidatus Woesearchaeota archaeon]|nr:glycosyltransferase family 4 protein [Candidatus Woesearchaeota archaeon]
METKEGKQEKKRLVIATDCFLPRWDGVTRFLLEILPRIREEFQITVLAPDFKGEKIKIRDIEVIRYPLRDMQFGDIYFSKFMYKEIKQEIEKADIVFSQTIGPIGLCGILAAKKLNKPIVSFIHSIEWELTTKSVKYLKGFTNITTRLLTRYLYNKCTMLIVPTQEVEEKLTVIGIKTPKEVINLGTDTKRFTPVENKEAAKKAVGIDPKDKVIGFCGRIGREKDIGTLYRAFRRIEKKHQNVKLLIVGEGLEEELFTETRNILHVGKQNNVVPYLQAMDIYVLPSLTETTSLSTLEAMACGIAVIATPVGYVKEYIKERYNGMLFPFKNSLVLSLKINLLLENEKLREKIAKNGRKTVEEKFQWIKTAEKIKKVLMEQKEN